MQHERGRGRKGRKEKPRHFGWRRGNLKRRESKIRECNITMRSTKCMRVIEFFFCFSLSTHASRSSVFPFVPNETERVVLFPIPCFTPWISYLFPPRLYILLWHTRGEDFYDYLSIFLPSNVRSNFLLALFIDFEIFRTGRSRSTRKRHEKKKGERVRKWEEEWIQFRYGCVCVWVTKEVYVYGLHIGERCVIASTTLSINPSTWTSRTVFIIFVVLGNFFLFHFIWPLFKRIIMILWLMWIFISYRNISNSKRRIIYSKSTWNVIHSFYREFCTFNFVKLLEFSCASCRSASPFDLFFFYNALEWWK